MHECVWSGAGGNRGIEWPWLEHGSCPLFNGFAMFFSEACNRSSDVISEHGIFDAPNVTRNVKALDQYYGRQVSLDNELDERYFINLNGLMHTPIKLISPLNHSSGKASGPKSNSSSNK